MGCEQSRGHGPYRMHEFSGDEGRAALQAAEKSSSSS